MLISKTVRTLAEPELTQRALCRHSRTICFCALHQVLFACVSSRHVCTVLLSVTSSRIVEIDVLRSPFQ